ncbi:MAG: hypothetical protein LBE31_03255, partial [Deltaproteobacteria bacterium]|nr:hypothetical protein [Deltaproteobacteria bacterium]
MKNNSPQGFNPATKPLGHNPTPKTLAKINPKSFLVAIMAAVLILTFGLAAKAAFGAPSRSKEVKTPSWRGPVKFEVEKVNNVDYVELVFKSSKKDLTLDLNIEDHTLLEPSEGLFDIVKAPEKSWIHHSRSDEGTFFTLVIPLSPVFFQNWLEQGNQVVLRWREGIEPNVVFLKEQTSAAPCIQAVPINLLTSPKWLDIETTSDSKTKFTFSNIKLTVASGIYASLRSGNNLKIVALFNRSMVEPESLNKKIEPQDFPISIKPDLGFSGQWLSPQIFELVTIGLSEADYGREVVDRWFEIKSVEGLSSLNGEKIEYFSLNTDVKSGKGGQASQAGQINKAGQAQKVNFDRFRVLKITQDNFDSQGRPIIAVFFNKAADKKTIAKQARWRLISGGEGQKSEDFKSMSLMETGAPGSQAPSGLSARFVGDLKNGQRLTLTFDSLTSSDGQGVITKSDPMELMIVNTITLNYYNVELQEFYPFKPYMKIRFGEQVLPQPLEKYISIEPEVDFSVQSDHGYLYVFAPFDRTRDLEVTIKKGFRVHKGSLNKDLTLKGRLGEYRKPNLIFFGEGKYLTPQAPMLARMAISDADLVALRAWKVYDDNLPGLINAQLGEKSLVNVGLSMQFSKPIFEGQVKVNGSDGFPMERLLDLREVLGDSRPGAYLIEAIPAYINSKNITIAPLDRELESFRNRQIFNHWPDYQYYFVAIVSDLGLMAKVTGDETTVWVTSLSESQPIAGVSLKFFDLANQVKAELVTNEDGLATISSLEDFSFLTATKGEDTSYLVLIEDINAHAYYNDTKWFGGGSAYLAPGRDGEAQYLDGSYEAFVFMPRDIYKPGEKIAVKAMIRDRMMMPPKEGFPLLWNLIGSDSRTVAQGTASVNLNGGLDFEASIPFSARPGKWQVELRVPESDNAIGAFNFTVDDFVPPRLKLSLSHEPNVAIGPEENVKLIGQADYLFGAPGAGLPWELTAAANIFNVSPQGYDEYDFLGLLDPGAPKRWVITDSTGTLDSAGKLDFNLPLTQNLLPQALTVNLAFKVMEDGGRFNGANSSFTWYPRGLLLGLKTPKENRIGANVTLSLAALRPVSRPEEFENAGNLSVEAVISKVTSFEYREYNYGGGRLKSVEELTEVFRGEIELKNGLGELDFVPTESGLYEINLIGPLSVNFRSRLTVQGLSIDPAPSKIETEAKLTVELDRALYAPGDKLEARLSAPFDGPVWVTLETDKTLYSGLTRLTNGTADIDLTVPPEVVQNVHLTAVAIRPLDSSKVERMVLGQARIDIDPNLKNLNVEINAPERFTPSAPALVKVKLTDSSGRPRAGEVTITLVDEAILSLTDYEIGSPLSFFTRTRTAISRIFRIFHMFLPPEEQVFPLLTPGGGDEARSTLFSPYQRETEPLSLMVATVWAGSDGLAEATLDLPEYSGRARLTVVAGSLDKFGLNSKSILVSRDLTVEATLPLALAPGDSFLAIVKIFTDKLAQVSPEASISFETEGPLTVIKAEDENGAIDPA